jgi:hypothetical protein
MEELALKFADIYISERDTHNNVDALVNTMDKMNITCNDSEIDNFMVSFSKLSINDKIKNEILDMHKYIGILVRHKQRCLNVVHSQNIRWIT